MSKLLSSLDCERHMELLKYYVKVSELSHLWMSGISLLS